MAQKNIKIGNKELKYNLPSNPNINKFIIRACNETSDQLSYYSVTTEMEEWVLVAGDDDCVIITIYGTTDNGKVVNEDYYKKPTSGEIETLSSEPFFTEWHLDRIQCEAEESVPSPNVSHPVFKLQAAQGSDPNYYVQILKDMNSGTKFIKLATSVNNMIIDDTIELESRRSYQYELYKVNKIDEQFVVTGVTNTYTTLKTRNSQSDVEQLMQKATSHINGSGNLKVKHLNREKPSDHDTIKDSKKTGILKKYVKDNNGDPYSSINKKIYGLHFSANPKNEVGDLSGCSYFGDYRIMIVPEYLVEGCNLYFADFYCMNSSRHWVTLVLTKRGSEEDVFCEHRLVMLDIGINPFFHQSVNESGIIEYKVTSHLVEILYTDDIDLKEMRLKPGFEEKVVIKIGKGIKSDGVPKKSSCSTCNLSK